MSELVLLMGGLWFIDMFDIGFLRMPIDDRDGLDVAQRIVEGAAAAPKMLNAQDAIPNCTQQSQICVLLLGYKFSMLMSKQNIILCTR